MFSLKPNLFIYNKNLINVSIVYAIITLIDLLTISKILEKLLFESASDKKLQVLKYQAIELITVVQYHKTFQHII